jgi:DNA-binding NarL/FixJ family response regulator
VVIPFRSIGELVVRATSATGALSCVLISVGGCPLAEAAPAEQLRQLREATSAVPVVVLSDREDYDEVAVAFRRGVRGFIPASLELGVAMEALKLVQAGGTYFPVGPLIGPRRKSLAEAACQGAPARDTGHHWSPRQLSVLRLLA